MPGEFPMEGKIQTIAEINDLVGVNWQFGLFTNDINPVNGTAFAQLTEAVFGGYARVPYLPFTPGYSRVDGHAGADRIGIVQFVGNGQGPIQTVYGWFIVKNGAGLVWAERFALPRSVGNAGDPVKLVVSSVLGKLPLA